MERPIRYVRDNFVYGREFFNDEDLDAVVSKNTNALPSP